MTFDLCVIGLGYIGLPTSVFFAQAGLKVLGVEVDQRKIDLLEKGICPIQEDELADRLNNVLRNGNLLVARTPARSKAFLLCLPTPVTLDRKADLSFVEAGCRTIAPFLERGDLVIVESTVPPGTCRDFVAPILKDLRGFDPEKDYLLAHAPERVIPGAIFRELTENVRIVGGVTPEAADRAAELYLQAGVLDVRKTTADIAELAKVVENTFRDVNIAFANELAAVCRDLGVDVFETIALANLHPRVNVHKPGIGVGGHCIPVDPWFLIHLCPKSTPLIQAARSVNDSKPTQVANDIIEFQGARNIGPIGILGVTYKANVEDTRESPALEVIHQLNRYQRDLLIFDPYAPNHSTATLEEVLALDTIAVLTDHDDFASITGPRVLRWNR